LLRNLFDAAVAACQPSRVVPPALPPRPSGRIVVVGAGKAAAAMTAAVEAAWRPPLSGLVVTRYGHGAPTHFVDVVEAGHPLPDDAGCVAAERALTLVQGLSEHDVVLALLSGGGSALWGLPLPPLSIGEKQAVTRALIRTRATIQEINCVRKHLSAIKGGRLAAAAHLARVLTLAISDVVGDDPSVIASGPTVGDATTQADARAILTKYRVPVVPAVERILSDGTLESIKPSDARVVASDIRIVARGADALAAACNEAHHLGFETRILGTDLQGDARAVALAHAEIARDAKTTARPLVLLSGGELTLDVSGAGRGGPNREYLLALAAALQGAEGIWAFAADTDGIDGSDDVAGGWIGPDTLSRANQLGIDGRQCAQDNNSGKFFADLGQSVVTGPTRTNVNDFRAILVQPSV
jgi:glycerate 2-kinase